MDDETLKRLHGAVLTGGNLWAFDPAEKPMIFRQVTGDHGQEEFRNLRNASLVMYHTLGNVEDWLELLISFLEAAKFEVAVDGALRVQAAINVSKRMAVEGLEIISANRKAT